MVDTNQNNEYRVKGQSSEGAKFQATLTRMSRFLAVFESYNTALVLRASESLAHFQIDMGERQIYAGRATVRSQINDGSKTTYEVTLDEAAWTNLEFTIEMFQAGELQGHFKDFIAGWQKLYRVAPEYKLIVADLHSFLSDLRLSLDQLEVNLQAMPPDTRRSMEQVVATELGKSAAPMCNALFEKFEIAAQAVQADAVPAHQTYARRQLHPLVSCAPFFYRCFSKPLGYAGDYEMVNMMMRNPCEGPTLFAKMLNLWFLDQPPVVAHRNRIEYLVQKIFQFTVRLRSQSQTPRIISLGCGPAHEVQRFLVEQMISNHTDFTLLDFNEETLRYTEKILSGLKAKHSRSTPLHYVKKSVHQLLKESARATEVEAGARYDLVYCAGLFDYFSEQVCHRLMNIMYGWLKPGGLLVATNVTVHNPSRGWMEHVTDWHLIYRDARQMQALIPHGASAEDTRVFVEPSGVNVFLEVEKAPHV